MLESDIHVCAENMYTHILHASRTDLDYATPPTFPILLLSSHSHLLCRDRNYYMKVAIYESCYICMFSPHTHMHTSPSACMHTLLQFILLGQAAAIFA